MIGAPAQGPWCLEQDLGEYLRVTTNVEKDLSSRRWPRAHYTDSFWSGPEALRLHLPRGPGAGRNR